MASAKMMVRAEDGARATGLRSADLERGRRRERQVPRAQLDACAALDARAAGHRAQERAHTRVAHHRRRVPGARSGETRGHNSRSGGRFHGRESGRGCTRAVNRSRRIGGKKLAVLACIAPRVQAPRRDHSVRARRLAQRPSARRLPFTGGLYQPLETKARRALTCRKRLAEASAHACAGASRCRRR
eukprot:6193301-Pleurochrysis_carterae.AAC.1